MEDLAAEIDIGINEHTIIPHHTYGEMYAYEIDGFSSFSLIDAANLPSLLSIPHMGHKPYRNTSTTARAPPSSAAQTLTTPTAPSSTPPGAPHLGPGMAWPMGLIMQIMTSHDDLDIMGRIRQLMNSTKELGLIHQSVNSRNDKQWTRQWFAWVNGLFGQMILDLAQRRPELIARSCQDMANSREIKM